MNMLLQIARLRDALISHLKWKRMIEPIVLAALYTTGCMVLPLFFPCTPTTCIMDAVRVVGLLIGLHWVQAGPLKTGKLQSITHCWFDLINSDL